MSSRGEPRARRQASSREKRNTARYFTETRQVALGAARRARCCGASSPTCTMPKAQGSAGPGAHRGRHLHLAGRQRREDRAAGHAQDRREDRRELQGREDRVDLAHQRRRSSTSRSKRASSIAARSSTTSSCKLDSIHDLPSGARPINFIKDFGDTAALMLTVASPQGRATSSWSCARARSAHAIDSGRAHGAATAGATLVVALSAVDQRRAAAARRPAACARSRAQARPARRAPHRGAGLLGIDVGADADDATAAAAAHASSSRERLQPVRASSRRLAAGGHPRSQGHARRASRAVAGDRYTYRELDDFTDRSSATCRRVPQVVEGARAPASCPSGSTSTTRRSGWPRYGLPASRSSATCSPARNITVPGRHARDRRQERHHRSVGRAHERAGDRRHAGRQRAGGRAACTCATSSTSAATTRARRATSTTTRARRRRQCVRIARHHARRADAAGRADRRFRRRRRRAARPRCSAAVARRSDPARAPPTSRCRSRRTSSLFMTQPVRGDRAGRHRRADRLLGMALGAADGAVDPDHAGDDLRLHAAARHRHPADLDRLADHRARPAGRRSGRRRRRDQALAGRRLAAALVAAWLGTDQAGDGDPVRDHHQHRRLPAVAALSAATSGSFIYTLAGRAHLLAGRLAHRLDDLHAAARLLPACARPEARADAGRAAHARLRQRYYARRRLGASITATSVLSVAVVLRSWSASACARDLKTGVLPARTCRTSPTSTSGCPRTRRSSATRDDGARRPSA